MATYAPTTHTAVATTFTYAISFSYERTDDVRVYLDDVEIARGSATDEWIYSGTDNINITLGAAVGHIDDQVITIKRVTDISDAATVYTNGSGFTHTDINTLANQLLFAIDELQVPAYVSPYRTVVKLYSDPVSEEHNLGGAPTRWHLHFRCISPEHGYAEGDLVDGHFANIQVWYYWTVTHLEMPSSQQYGNVTLPHATDLNQIAIDEDKWEVVIQAWR
jgi:hypothetical protein